MTVSDRMRIRQESVRIQATASGTTYSGRGHCTKPRLLLIQSAEKAPGRLLRPWAIRSQTSRNVFCMETIDLADEFDLKRITQSRENLSAEHSRDHGSCVRRNGAHQRHRKTAGSRIRSSLPQDCRRGPRLLGSAG